ncbi:dTMP kinase [Entomoplasma freundtii]|uniref:Thymidylate kinase n=1 Tax=Entomoplasma freundtii TaxID=74700 RepID=A0A2K8NSA3_9MOLU|nr:dTMP kinase [Entomoplasma freundtii]ATZ16720.1 thymidylate kinase [Entomoplasma freundtii]TDY58113.1 dTMP kinase [Entomoplasma freundtii]
MFITIEGVDGSGKTTAIKKVAEKLEKAGYEVLLTREPGGEKISEQIRHLILADQSEGMDPWTEALLYLAARREHLSKVIIPALKANKIVISDRFMDSTSAYQGHGRGLGLEAVDTIQRVVVGDYVPNLTIYFDLDPQEAQRRLKTATKTKNRFDLEKKEFKDLVREGYQKLLQKYPDRFRVVDANQSLDNVEDQISRLIFEALENANHPVSSKTN